MRQRVRMKVLVRFNKAGKFARKGASISLVHTHTGLVGDKKKALLSIENSFSKLREFDVSWRQNSAHTSSLFLYLSCPHRHAFYFAE